MVIVIKDNGLGIPLNKNPETGIGTTITRERIALLDSNAQIQIESHTDEDHHGTTVTIAIPLKTLKN